MQFSKLWRSVLAFGMLAFVGGLPDIASAGPRQQAILQSYIGNWSGAGLLTGGDAPEKFSCRNQISDGGEGKINFQGRCSVAGMNLSIYGTIKYNDDTRRFEGVMHSNTEFQGVAIGMQRGSNIVFDFKDQRNREGHDLTIGSQIILKQDTYVVEFDVWVADSDVKMSTSVPFKRR